MNQILDLEVESNPLKDSVRQELRLSQNTLAECLQATESILSDTFCQDDLKKAFWYSLNWLQFTLENALNAFGQKCDRWRKLYDDALNQLDTASLVIRRFGIGNITQAERLKYGYNITTHFRYLTQGQAAIIQAADGTPLLKLTYGATAKIWRINRGLKKNTDERGFKLDARTRIWGDPRNEQATDSLHTEVNLMVEETCNILVVEPLSVPNENKEAFITTLQYTLEPALQAVYKLEANELDSERLGEEKYLLFWEAAEGGAGVLSQLLEKPVAFQKIADASLDICHFKQPKESCVQACYECLLSYQNQFGHALINRHLIKPLLQQLLASTVVCHVEGMSRDEQYQ